ncbi:hypothetical protein AAFF_G00019000 [Aldrovandia affinis]|uniref:Uncharacterized protein n=1 Tax=Aldrovandia affinis TaxID=143900 RepID=A0AAD7S5H6_9TELE|nr:hypothetical protein AAFF_G00019000 [Aldrovandia affinis]
METKEVGRAALSRDCSHALQERVLWQAEAAVPQHLRDISRDASERYARTARIDRVRALDREPEEESAGRHWGGLRVLKNRLSWSLPKHRCASQLQRVVGQGAALRVISVVVGRGILRGGAPGLPHQHSAQTPLASQRPVLSLHGHAGCLGAPDPLSRWHCARLLVDTRGCGSLACALFPPGWGVTPAWGTSHLSAGGRVSHAS